MKKIVSIVLTMVMLISTCTVALVALAARPGGNNGGDTPSTTVDVADVISKINAQTKFIAEAEDDEGETHILPGYAFERTVNPSVSVSMPSETLASIMASAYPEYAEAPYCVDGAYSYTEILKSVIGVSESQANVKKNSDAILTIGSDALFAYDLKADDVVSAKVSGKTYTLTYADVDIVADEKVEDSILPSLTNSYPSITGLDNAIVSSAKQHNTGLTFGENTLKITDIKLTVMFDTSSRIVDLGISYKVTGNLTFSYIGDEVYNAVISETVSTGYKAFDYFEDGDFDYAELAEKINDATAYMTEMKSGYDYARNNTWNQIENSDGSFTDYLFTVSTEGQISGNMILSIVVGAVFGIVDQITIGIDDALGTNICTQKWVCKLGEDSEDACSAAHPHQVWNCTCKDVDGCCDCCGTTGCTSTHPCDRKDDCTSVDCACGYIDDPECKYVDNTTEKTENLDATVNSAMNTLGSLLDSTIADSAKEQLVLGATAGSVPVANEGTEFLDSRYAVKETSLDVFDIEEASFDEETGSIIFTMADQDAASGYVALSHLTNDFVTNDDFVSALNLSALEGETFVNSDLIYTDIVCTVKFNGADEENIYGDGTIEKINLTYNCTATSEGIVGYAFSTNMKSTVKNIEYADYEKGDVDMSTRVSVLDAKLTLRAIAELETLSDYQAYLADMNEDNEVSIVDAKMILEKIVSQSV